MALPPEPPARARRKWISRDVSDFEKMDQIGEGTYGQVWMGKDKKTGRIVALKKVRMDNEREGFPLTAIREIKLLKTMYHRNIVSLCEIVTGKGDSSKTAKHSIFMVFEYVDHDLTGLLNSPKIKLNIAQIKCLVKQLLTGLKYCHDRDILHRDIKGSNLLYSNDGTLKIADFGLARLCNDHHSQPCYTNRVITLWYRPPELLLGETNYGAAVDMWSSGCLVAEFLIGRTLFPGTNETEQTKMIFNMLGFPTDDVWPKWRNLPHANLLANTNQQPILKPHLQKRNLSPDAIDFIENLLILDPSRRLTAGQALAHPWFRTEPLPCSSFELPKLEEHTHEFQAKVRHQEKKKLAVERKEEEPRIPREHEYEKRNDHYPRVGVQAKEPILHGSHNSHNNPHNTNKRTYDPFNTKHGDPKRQRE